MSSKKTNDQSFWGHLDELRGSIVRSLLCFLSLSIAGFIFKSFLFDTIILAPANSDFIVYRLLGMDMKMELINVEISAQFFVHLKAAAACGLVLSFPILIWEIWKFIAPGLYASERKPIRAAFLLSSGLFYLGVVVGYFVVLPVCLQFFMNYTVSSDVTNAITLSSYMSMFTSLVLMIGIVFEFPTVVIALAQIGILDKSKLKKGRKFAIVITLVLAAIITPADPFSMIVLFAPLYLLYEFSILLCPDAKVEED